MDTLVLKAASIRGVGATGRDTPEGGAGPHRYHIASMRRQLPHPVDHGPVRPGEQMETTRPVGTQEQSPLHAQAVEWKRAIRQPLDQVQCLLPAGLAESGVPDEPHTGPVQGGDQVRRLGAQER